MTEINSQFANLLQVCVCFGFRCICISKVLENKLLGTFDNRWGNDFSSISVRNVLEAIIDEMNGFVDGFIKKR